MAGRCSAARYGQLVVAFAEALEAHRKADALLGVWKMMKVAVWPVRSCLIQVFVHDHLGDAAVRQAAHEAGPTDVDLVDLEPETRRQQHPMGAARAKSLLFWSAVLSTITVRRHWRGPPR